MHWSSQSTRAVDGAAGTVHVALCTYRAIAIYGIMSCPLVLADTEMQLVILPTLHTSAGV